MRIKMGRFGAAKMILLILSDNLNLCERKNVSFPITK
jgi:hypothetical protein